MKTLRLLWLAVMMVAVGCSKDPVGVKPIDGVDPTVLVLNPTSETLYMTWYAQNAGVVSTTVIPPNSTTCSNLIVPIADSVMIVTWTPVYTSQTIITDFDSAFTVASGVPHVRDQAWSAAYSYSPFFIAGQPIEIVNGHYVSDFWTVQAAPRPGVVPAAAFTSVGADSTAPC